MRLSFMILALGLTACQQPHGFRSSQEVKTLMQQHQLTDLTLDLSQKTHQRPLFTLLRSGTSPEKSLAHVYIEGDGLAYITPDVLCDDPTPTDPVGLKLALADQTQRPVFYLARPGHYMAQHGWPDRYWDQARFSGEVIQVYQQLLEVLKTQYALKSFVLYGYSGGGAIAALLAAQRSDVVGLVTFAGNLEPAVWTRHHGHKPLTESLNPADYAPQLSSVRQVHYGGQEDSVIIPDVLNAYKDRFSSSCPIGLQMVPGVTHWEGWPEWWRTINQPVFSASGS